jgi:heme oxygenase (mycobilin-producing)
MVRYINLFEVPEGRDDEFMAMFLQVNAHMTAQPGYLGHRMHRALAPDARYRYVNYVEWASVDDFKAAHGEEFRALVSKPEWRDFFATPALYDVVHEHSAVSN